MTASARSARRGGAARSRDWASRRSMWGGVQSGSASSRSSSSVRACWSASPGLLVRRRRRARVSASGVLASLMNEAVAGCVIVIPSGASTLGLPYKHLGRSSRDTPMSIGFSGAGSASWRVRGDVRICNENPAILAVCLRVGRVLSRPLAIRGGVSAGHRGCDTPGSQKAPSAIRCIKTAGIKDAVGSVIDVRKHLAP